MDSLLRGLVAFYPLYEAAGTRVNMVAPGVDDLSVDLGGDMGGNLTGILQNSSYSTGVTGKRTADPAVTVDMVQGNWAISCWILAGSIGGNRVWGPNQWYGVNRRQWYAEITTGGVPAFVVGSDCNNLAATASAPYVAVENEWFNMVVMMDDDNDLIHCWANGRLGSAAWAGVMCANAGPLCIGRTIDASGNSNFICELGVWKRMLTPREVIEGLWNRGRGSTFPFNHLRTPLRGHQASLGKRRTRFEHAMRM